MKNFTLIVCAIGLLLPTVGLFGQDAAALKPEFIDPTKADTVKHWKYDGNAAININQVALKNWAGGGQSSVGMGAIFGLKASYAKNNFSWDIKADMAFGVQKIGKQEFRKSDDFFELSSQLNYKFKKGWRVALLTTLRSQFAPGYEYPADTSKVLISKGFSPAYTIIAPGIEYRAPKYFTILFSPITNKNNVVIDNVNINETRYGVAEGKKVFAQAGAFLTTTFAIEVVKNVTYTTKLDLFSNYLKNPQNIDINWTNNVVMKVNSFLNVTVSTELVYDDDVNVPKTRKDGSIYEGKGTQFRQGLTIGIGYKFKSKEVAK
jgi:hypothetical protein